MSDNEIMYALQCCSPNSKNDRDCWSCPFNGSTECHTELCNTMIDYIMRTQSKSERLHEEIKRLNDMTSTLCTM